MCVCVCVKSNDVQTFALKLLISTEKNNQKKTKNRRIHYSFFHLFFWPFFFIPDLNCNNKQTNKKEEANKFFRIILRSLNKTNDYCCIHYSYYYGDYYLLLFDKNNKKHINSVRTVHSFVSSTSTSSVWNTINNYNKIVILLIHIHT